MDGYRNAVRCMGVQPGERVLVVTDTLMEPRIPESLAHASALASARADVIEMEPTGRHGAEPPEHVAKSMLEYDVIFMPTTFSLTHTKAREAATDSGARIASMPGITVDIMESGAMLADYNRVKELVEIAANMLEAKHIRLASPSGTDVEFEIISKPSRDTGMFTSPGDYGNLPAGEAFAAIGGGNGRVVFDIFGGRYGVEVDVRNNEGHSAVLESMVAGLPAKARQLAEFGIGANPSARVTGNILEDEKAFHTVHLAFGNNAHFGGSNDVPFHEDGIIIKPTVEADGVVVIEDGEWRF